MITVDRRQPPETTQLLLGLDIPARVDTLVTGDETWESPLGSVGVEEKTWDELLTLGDRIDDELSRCIDSFAVPVLMVLGEIREEYGLAVPTSYTSPVKKDFDRLDNNLFEWQLRGLVLKHCPQPANRIYRLASLWRWTTKAEHRTVFVRQRKLPNLGKLGPRAEVLAALPTIGIKRATTLAKVEVSLSSMFGWGEGTWASYLGSRAAAKKIMGLIRGRP